MKLTKHDGWGGVWGPGIDLKGYNDIWGDPCIVVSQFVEEPQKVADYLISVINNHEALKEQLNKAQLNVKDIMNNYQDLGAHMVRDGERIAQLEKDLAHARGWAKWRSSYRETDKPRTRHASDGWDGFLCEKSKSTT